MKYDVTVVGWRCLSTFWLTLCVDRRIQLSSFQMHFVFSFTKSNFTVFCARTNDHAIYILKYMVTSCYMYTYTNIAFFCSLLYLTNVQACRIRFKETLNISKRQYLDWYCSTSIFYKVFCIASKVIFCHWICCSFFVLNKR